MTSHKISGFTLMELLLVMILISILTFIIAGNYLTSMKKGRDMQRKADLSSMQKTLEMFYEDVGRYPLPTEFNLASTSDIQLCYPGNCSRKIYTSKAPKDPSDFYYQYCVNSAANPTAFQLYAYIENTSDKNIITPSKYATCTSEPCTTTDDCNYGIASQNAVP